MNLDRKWHCLFNGGAGGVLLKIALEKVMVKNILLLLNNIFDIDW